MTVAIQFCSPEGIPVYPNLYGLVCCGLKLPSGFRESQGGYHNIQMFVSFHLSPHKLPRPRDRSELARYELVLPPLLMLEAYGTRVMTPRRSSVLFSDVEIQGVVLNFTNSALWVEMLYSGDITCQKLCSRIAAAPREWQVRLADSVGGLSLFSPALWTRQFRSVNKPPLGRSSCGIYHSSFTSLLLMAPHQRDRSRCGYSHISLPICTC